MSEGGGTGAAEPSAGGLGKKKQTHHSTRSVHRLVCLRFSFVASCWKDPMAHPGAQDTPVPSPAPHAPPLCPHSLVVGSSLSPVPHTEQHMERTCFPKGVLGGGHHLWCPLSPLRPHHDALHGGLSPHFGGLPPSWKAASQVGECQGTQGTNQGHHWGCWLEEGVWGRQLGSRWA